MRNLDQWHNYLSLAVTGLYPWKGYTMQALVVAIGVVMIVMGIVQLVFSNAVWMVDRTFNEMNGVEPKRTDVWEVGRVVRAIVSILGGVLAIWLASAVVRP